MARKPRDTRLETREARQRLKAQHEPYWRQLHEGLFIGYRKSSRGGVWYVRTYQDGKYRKRRLGPADDTVDADGETVLGYTDAVRKAMEGIPRDSVAGYTVSKALDDYLADLKTRAKSYEKTEYRVEDIRRELGDRKVENLTSRQIRDWLNRIAATDDPDKKRPRMATANRTLTVLKAALNHAYRDEKVSSDSAWRRVRPFRNADQPRIRYLTRDESVRLVNAAPPDFRPLIRAALLTGCRWGELVAMRAGDYDPDAGTIRVRDSKGGGGRHVPLTEEGQQLFDELTADMGREDIIFTRETGEPWAGANHHRPMRRACAAAKIDPPVGFHVLRHTYGSLLALKGVPLQVIARALGHRDSRMTERHYAHLQPDHVADTVRASLPSFEQKGKKKGAKVERIERRRANG